MTVNSRPFEGDGDALLLTHIVTRLSLTSPTCSYWHAGDVWWGLYKNTEFQPQYNVRLWFDDDVPIGFAWFFPPGGVSTQVIPERADEADLDAEMLRWAEDRRRDLPAGDEGHYTLTATAFAHDARRIDLLTQHGYERAGTHMYHFRRSLSGATVPAALTTGITVRMVSDRSEWNARVDLHRDVWHPSKVTLDAYQRLRATPGYQCAFDLVAVTEEGTFTSYCICWFDPITQTGEFEPVGTSSTFRRQGHGRAVILEGFRLLQERGATAAIVYTPHTNGSARALYESVGFRIVGSEYDYIKRIERNGGDHAKVHLP